MCGIAGQFNFGNLERPVDAAVVHVQPASVHRPA